MIIALHYPQRKPLRLLPKLNEANLMISLVHGRQRRKRRPQTRFRKPILYGHALSTWFICRPPQLTLYQAAQSPRVEEGWSFWRPKNQIWLSKFWEIIANLWVCIESSKEDIGDDDDELNDEKSQSPVHDDTEYARKRKEKDEELRNMMDDDDEKGNASLYRFSW